MHATSGAPQFSSAKAAVPQGSQGFEAADERQTRQTNQNLVPKARTKKELAEQKADEEKLAACRKMYHDYGHERVVQN